MRLWRSVFGTEFICSGESKSKIDLAQDKMLRARSAMKTFAAWASCFYFAVVIFVRYSQKDNSQQFLRCSVRLALHKPSSVWSILVRYSIVWSIQLQRIVLKCLSQVSREQYYIFKCVLSEQLLKIKRFNLLSYKTKWEILTFESLEPAKFGICAWNFTLWLYDNDICQNN